MGSKLIIAALICLVSGLAGYIVASEQRAKRLERQVAHLTTVLDSAEAFGTVEPQDSQAAPIAE